MRKLTHLRDHLLASVPELKRDPAKLLTFIEDGNIEFWEGPNLSHMYTMPIRLIITDFGGDVDDIMVPILSWLKVREPGLDPANTISFEAELLNNSCFDLSITLNITEHVIVKAVDGALDIEHVLPDPPLTMNDDAEWQVIADLQGYPESVDGDQ